MSNVREFMAARDHKWVYVAMSIPAFEGVVTRCLPAKPKWKRTIERLVIRAEKAGLKGRNNPLGQRSFKLDRGWPYASLWIILQDEQWG